MKIIDWSNYTIKKSSNGLDFSNGETITDYHEQNWCEDVYVDWGSIDEGIFNQKFSGVPIIEFVEDCGIRINTYFVPCYDKQNGYYSSDLELICSWLADRIDITTCTNYILD